MSKHKNKAAQEARIAELCDWHAAGIPGPYMQRLAIEGAESCAAGPLYKWDVKNTATDRIIFSTVPAGRRKAHNDLQRFYNQQALYDLRMERPWASPNTTAK